MVRLAILLALAALSLWEWARGTHKPLYWLALIALGVFFSLRYGQGTDYITYMGVYTNIPPLHTFPVYSAYHFNRVEIGYFYLNSFFRMLGAHYALFVAFVAVFSLVALHRFIRAFKAPPLFSLTVFFAVYSITYVESAFRQMLALAIAIGFVFVYWKERKRAMAMVAIAVATLFHTSAAVLFLLPALLWVPRKLFILEWRLRTTLAVVALFAGAAAVINLVDLSPLIERLPSQLANALSTYYGARSFSVMALLNRTLFAGIAFVLAWLAKDKLKREEKLLFNLYMIGYALYCLFLSRDLIASRANVYFRVADVILLPLLLERNRELARKTIVAVPVILALLGFLYVKDIAAIMNFADYYDSNPLHYPYVTVLNAKALLDHKFVNVKNANAINVYETGGFNWNEYTETLQRKPLARSPIVPY